MKLLSPKTRATRPITDMAKESLFNVLRGLRPVQSACIADLFCGTGSLGLEALSRGAESVIFVEQDPQTIQTLKRNIARAGFEGQAQVLKADAFRSRAWAAPGRKFDVVFVDPPYVNTRDTNPGSRLGRLLLSLGDIIMPEGVVIARTHKHTALQDDYGRLNVLDRRKWGTMLVTILGPKDD